MAVFISSVAFLPASSGDKRSKRTSEVYRLMISWMAPAPFGGGAGASPSSSLIWSMNLTTLVSAGVSLGAIAARTSELGYTPRSARSASPAFTLLVRKLMNFAASCGCLVREEADQNCEALYQSWASSAAPALEGKRRIFRSPPDAFSSAGAWLDHQKAIAFFPVARPLWSSGAASASTTSAAGGTALFWLNCFRKAHQPAMSPGSKPSLPSEVYRDLPFCRSHT